MIYFGEFLKPEGCSQKVLPDRSILIGGNLLVLKFKCDILDDFEALWKCLPRNNAFIRIGFSSA